MTAFHGLGLGVRALQQFSRSMMQRLGHQPVWAMLRVDEVVLDQDQRNLNDARIRVNHRFAIRWRQFLEWLYLTETTPPDPIRQTPSSR